MRREDLTSRLSHAGLRLEDAATAARIAVQMHLGERNEMIVAARRTLSLREIGVIFDISQVQVMRILRRHGLKGDSQSAAEKMRNERNRIIRAASANLSKRQISNMLNLSEDQVSRVLHPQGVHVTACGEKLGSTDKSREPEK